MKNRTPSPATRITTCSGNPPANPGKRTSYMTRPGDPPSPDDPLLQFAPVPHKAPRRNSITAARQRAFIAALAATGVVNQAARTIGASLEALYKLRHRPGAEEFALAWDEAVDCAVRRIEDCALARAIEGEERMVVSSGKLIGTEIRHNEALVMFFLRNRRANRYGPQIEPGHPLYERIRAEVLAEEEARMRSEESPIETLLAKLDLMREREEACRLLLAEDPDRWDDDDDDEDEEEEEEAGDHAARPDGQVWAAKD